jgi:uncharacterized protein YndB with AHSA1/START domain
MSIKKDASGRRSIEVEVEVPGTPEEVWEAIATGPGVSSWFVPTKVREDGTVVKEFGPGMESIAKQTAWDPPHRFAAESDFGRGAPKMATEWIVEARSGGTCLVRVVHSLFASTDDWDNQLENVESGWPTFFRILRLYLTHFKNQPSHAFYFMGTSSEPESDLWPSLTGSLGLSGSETGQRRSTSSNAPRLAGIVEATGDAGHPHQILMRLDEPAAGIAHIFALKMGPQVLITVRVFFYGDEAATTAMREQPVWQAWIKDHVSPLGGSGGGTR